MNERVLLSDWQQIKAPYKNNAVMDTLTDCEELKRKIRQRNRKEVITAFVLIPFFGVIPFFISSVYTQVGSSIIALYCLLVILMLKNKKEADLPDVLLPSIIYLNKYLDYLKKQAKLLDAVIYWYILPPMIGLILFVIGLDLSLFHTILFLSVMVFINLRIYYLNRKVVIKDFNPKIASLQRLLDEEINLNTT